MALTKCNNSYNNYFAWHYSFLFTFFLFSSCSALKPQGKDYQAEVGSLIEDLRNRIFQNPNIDIFNEDTKSEKPLRFPKYKLSRLRPRFQDILNKLRFGHLG